MEDHDQHDPPDESIIPDKQAPQELLGYLKDCPVNIVLTFVILLIKFEFFSIETRRFFGDLVHSALESSLGIIPFFKEIFYCVSF